MAGAGRADVLVLDAVDGYLFCAVQLIDDLAARPRSTSPTRSLPSSPPRSRTGPSGRPARNVTWLSWSPWVASPRCSKIRCRIG